MLVTTGQPMALAVIFPLLLRQGLCPANSYVRFFFRSLLIASLVRGSTLVQPAPAAVLLMSALPQTMLVLCPIMQTVSTQCCTIVRTRQALRVLMSAGGDIHSPNGKDGIYPIVAAFERRDELSVAEAASHPAVLLAREGASIHPLMLFLRQPGSSNSGRQARPVTLTSRLGQLKLKPPQTACLRAALAEAGFARRKGALHARKQLQQQSQE